MFCMGTNDVPRSGDINNFLLLSSFHMIDTFDMETRQKLKRNFDDIVYLYDYMLKSKPYIQLNSIN